MSHPTSNYGTLTPQSRAPSSSSTAVNTPAPTPSRAPRKAGSGLGGAAGERLGLSLAKGKGVSRVDSVESLRKMRDEDGDGERETLVSRDERDADGREPWERNKRQGEASVVSSVSKCVGSNLLGGHRLARRITGDSRLTPRRGQPR